MYHVERTLYILNDKAHIYCDNDRIAIDIDGNKYYFGYDNIESIVIFTNKTTLSVYTMRNCAEHKITIHYVSEAGKFMGSFVGYENGNVLLRKMQFDMIGTEKATGYVQNVLAAKLKNSVWLLKTAGHHSAEKDKIKQSCNEILRIRDEMKNELCLDNLRLMEANAARLYFSVFDDLIKADDDMKFEKRTYRPALNNFNALLSFFYTMMTSLCESALCVRGLDSECGYLHTLRSGRHSLACDLVEEFRAVIVDRFVLTMVNRKQVTARDFTNDNGKILLSDEARKKLLSLWEGYLNSKTVHHNLLDKDMSLKVLVYEQAQLLAQFIREDISEYPPFFAK